MTSSESSSSAVSVPCPACSAAVRWGNSRCPSCSAKVSAELRAALEARLEASHGDYRELVDNTRSAATVLVVLGLLHVLVGVFLFTINYRVDLAGNRDLAHGVAHLVVSGGIGVLMLAAWKFARTSPAAAIAFGTTVWVLGHVLGALTSLLPLTSGLLIKALALMLLIRGIFAGLRANQLKRRLATNDQRAD